MLADGYCLANAIALASTASYQQFDFIQIYLAGSGHRQLGRFQSYIA